MSCKLTLTFITSRLWASALHWLPREFNADDTGLCRGYNEICFQVWLHTKKSFRALTVKFFQRFPCSGAPRRWEALRWKHSYAPILSSTIFRCQWCVTVHTIIDSWRLVEGFLNTPRKFIWILVCGQCCNDLFAICFLLCVLFWERVLFQYFLVHYWARSLQRVKHHEPSDVLVTMTYVPVVQFILLLRMIARWMNFVCAHSILNW